MWILRFDYRFHYGNQAKETAAPTSANINSEDTNRVMKWFIMMNDTRHTSDDYRLTILL